ncbi:cysteine hydrolase family protein [Woodsholea maritima]|uniref:cysteine hydrolase family protein n=1 Tax=Woodsholea maritima TaxID=240237 RepID=UPI0003788451|nr:isochorismatase family protein [Woodsholea maritima]
MFNIPILLCVDLQKEFITPHRPWADPRGEAIAETCRQVIAAARAHDWFVVHTQLHRGGPLIDGEGLPQAIKGCEPRPGEVVLKRAGISAYAHPDLEGVLEGGGPDGAVMIGFSGPMSLTTTLYDAVDRGHKVSLLREACGSTEVGEWDADHTRELCLATAQKLNRLVSQADFAGQLGEVQSSVSRRA